MAYDPADLKLPHWLLAALDQAVRIRLPLAPGWRIGFTRPGILFVATLFGIWSAALYSGNNLLYLCGAMLTALIATALIAALRLLYGLPPLAPLMPAIAESHSAMALRRRQAWSAPRAAVVEIAWHSPVAEVLALRLRLDGEELTLGGRLLLPARGIYPFADQWLSSEAPLGLWHLERRRNEAWSLAVVPQPLPLGSHGESRQRTPIAREGDEWRDLRGYVVGDPLSRIHWRKSALALEGGSWLVKRFGAETPQQGEARLLRVDLRCPPGHEAAFETLLARCCGWLRLIERDAAGCELILGQQRFALDRDDGWMAALCALAAARPEAQPPAGSGGILLSLVQP